MRIRLNGWQRLWIVASCLYFVFVVTFVVLEFPQPEKISYSYVPMEKMSAASRALVISSFIDPDLPDAVVVVGTRVNMPNGVVLSFKKDTSEKQMRTVADEYWDIVAATVFEKRLSLIEGAFLFWTGPCAIIYILGMAIHWVSLGFRSS